MDIKDIADEYIESLWQMANIQHRIINKLYVVAAQHLTVEELSNITRELEDVREIKREL